MSNPVGRCALVNSDSIVVNIVAHNGDDLPENLSDHFLVPIEGVFCGAGFLYNPEDGTFIDTRPEPVIPDEVITE